MKITLSKYAGFCDGVARAYAIVEKIANDPNVKRPIFVLGSLVHNVEVVAKIESLGVKKINIEGELADFFKKIKGKVGTLVITAHGLGPEIYMLARKYEIDLVDATCPRVIKVQRLAKNFSDKNFQLVLIGEKEHKEVVGISQWGGGKVSFIENKADLKEIYLNSKLPIAVLSQTTQDQEFVQFAGQEISRKYPTARVFDSICLATHNRQTEVMKLATEHEVVIIIGDPTSSNSKRLWEAAKRINKNSYFIQKAQALEVKWFENKKTVAVGAGASTPEWIIKEVIAKLNRIKTTSLS
jgi:(E)-4-hydroxy-3-methyl-but-2-enyl pyrophosphate reductase